MCDIVIVTQSTEAPKASHPTESQTLFSVAQPVEGPIRDQSFI